MPSLEQCEQAAPAETAIAGPAALNPVAKPVTVEPVIVTVKAPVVRAKSGWRPSTRRLIVLACIVLGMRIFVGEASVVPTASMEGTILVGDHLFMDKLLYGPEIPLVGWRLPMLKTIHRGDIIVFRYPKDMSETFLKRVTAVGGDQLEIRNGMLYVNSQPVQEPYAVHHAPLHSPLESWGPTVVPAGSLFVMGDNRDNSSDSRDWGFVLIIIIIMPLFTGRMTRLLHAGSMKTWSTKSLFTLLLPAISFRTRAGTAREHCCRGEHFSPATLCLRRDQIFCFFLLPDR